MTADRLDENLGGTTATLARRLRLTTGRPDEFIGRAPTAPPRIYGGELAAQVLAAANATVDADRVAHVLQCTYLAAGDPTEQLHHQVRRIRDGRSFSTRTVRVRNAGRLVLTAVVGYQVADTGLVHQLAMPAVADPDQLPAIADAEGTAWTRWAAQDRDIDMRAVPSDPADPTGRRRFWCRVLCDVSEDRQQHTALAAYLSDFTMVASIRLPHEKPDVKQHLMSSLSHNVYFHRPVRPDEWLLFDHYSPVAAGSRGLALAHVYSQDGRLVITAVQEGLIRPLPADYR